MVRSIGRHAVAGVEDREGVGGAEVVGPGGGGGLASVVVGEDVGKVEEDAVVGRHPSADAGVLELAGVALLVLIEGLVVVGIVFGAGGEEGPDGEVVGGAVVDVGLGGGEVGIEVYGVAGFRGVGGIKAPAAVPLGAANGAP